MKTKLHLHTQKKVIYFFLALVMAVACSDETADDKNTDEQEKFSKQKYSLPQNEIEYYNNLGNRLSDTFYFIGWSKDGKAAYITEPADEATGYYYFNFVIFDTRNNKILYEWEIDETDGVYEGNLGQTWENNKAKFTEELTTYKIYPEKVGISRFPLMYEKENYSLKHETDYEQHEFFPVQVVSHTEIFLETQSQKYSIYKEDYEGDLELNVKATGCIISPYGNDALLTVAEEQRGYEGPPHLIRLRPAGFSFPE